MKCAAVFCENEATTIIKLKHTNYRGRVRCDSCTDIARRQFDNPERPDMFTGRMEYIPIAAREGNAGNGEE